MLKRFPLLFPILTESDPFIRLHETRIGHKKQGGLSIGVSVTLEGAGEGSLWYITPTWSTLKDANVWGDAASQIFYSLGIGCGSLVTLSSYNSFTNNCHRDAIFVSITNLFTSIFAGFVIFSILGFLAKQMQMPIEEVVQSGTGLAFIAYPEAVVRMPLPNLWAVLFFVMLFILGLGSQFAGVQAINAAILDVRPDLRKYESYVILGICFFCWFLGIPMIFDGGIYLFTLMDWNTASWAILLIGFAEVVLASWCYGCNKFLRNIGEMQMKFGRFLYSYWWLSWVVLAPITCLVSALPTTHRVHLCPSSKEMEVKEDENKEEKEEEEEEEEEEDTIRTKENSVKLFDSINHLEPRKPRDIFSSSLSTR
ncbi:sodium- and chloride-dependent glycine transporter 1-like isoform X2 [Vespula maculifrons]|uniref:Sodium- and chloride-dependent glycine transporter 1-like isoform X2 n=1 Tax=Vespula maculifrons TaxID=7453 RepID=A0ABD2BZP7_VESMC